MSSLNYGAVLSAASSPPVVASPGQGAPAIARYRFGGGNPDPATFPYDGLAAATAKVMAEQGAEALIYGEAQGYAPLRDLIAKKYALYEQLTVSPDQIVVTNGSSDAIRLICSALLDPGDTVLIEAPTFLGSLRTLQGTWPIWSGCRWTTTASSSTQMTSIIQRERANGKKVKLLYTIPTFQNPGGSTMPLARRQALLEVAQREGLVIMEDDAYGDLRAEGEFVPSLFALDQHGIVARTGTMSKILGAGLRVGWLVAATPAGQSRPRREVRRRNQSLHHPRRPRLHGRAPRRARRRVDRGLYGQAHRHARSAGGARRPRARRALAAAQGDFFIWIRLPDRCDIHALADTAAARGVSYVPGPAFDNDWQADWPEADRYIRLAYSYEQPDAIREGVAQLGRAIIEASV